MIYLNYHQYYNTGSIHYKFCSPCMHLTNILDYMIVLVVFAVITVFKKQIKAILIIWI